MKEITETGVIQKAGAGIFVPTLRKNVAHAITYPHKTNSTAELYAIIIALSIVLEYREQL